MRTLFRIADSLSKLALALAALILVYAVAHILLETLLRSVFSISTQVLNEFIGFATLSITFLSLSYTLRADGMIRVNLVTSILPKSYQQRLEALVSFFGCGLVGFFCIFLWRNFSKNWHRGAVSESVAEVPLWIPDAIVLIGASLLVLQLFLRGVVAVYPTPDTAHTAR
ncbi:TRAP transporter small permease [Limibacillus sp. MBR-115]|jgi:TRAP-type C4-dicarboxylate transport system permease small subunit|uniref:TRAP transporter small permease subunit n=1 Tax=Limibacillus sp. MBR-115 TaxID=3156465 RepID=UPI0033922EAC